MRLFFKLKRLGGERMKIYKLLMAITTGFLTLAVGAVLFSSNLYALNSNSYSTNATSYAVNKYNFNFVPEGRPIGMTKFTGDIYFSQSYFEHSSYEYDSHLATASMCVAMSSFQDYGEKTDEWYYNQSKHIQHTLETIGFNSFTANEDYRQTRSGLRMPRRRGT